MTTIAQADKRGNPQPVIILVEPQMGENIGMCARAMLNCGLNRLRLVNPRDGWPQESARATAADADEVIEKAGVFETLDAAIADCVRVFATTARDRALSTPVRNLEEAAAEVDEVAGEGTVAILFGPEASGLDRESVSRADTLLRIPTNPEFPSLNLAQAVLLFGWEWKRAARPAEPLSGEIAVERRQLESFLKRMEAKLDESGFFLTEEMKPHSMRTLRSLFARMLPSERDLQFLHGVLTALSVSSTGEDGEKRKTEDPEGSI